MVKVYKGYSVPKCVDDPHYRGTLLNGAESARSCVACRTEIPAGCSAVCCSDCILQMGLWDKAVRLKRLHEYVKANPIANPCEWMPELRPGDAYDIIEGKTPDLGAINSWKRPNPVREMTVDEISGALGYKVKVVGSNDKADD